MLTSPQSNKPQPLRKPQMNSNPFAQYPKITLALIFCLWAALSTFDYIDERKGECAAKGQDYSYSLDKCIPQL